MPLPQPFQSRREPSLGLPRRDHERLRRWLEICARDQLRAAATPDVLDVLPGLQLRLSDRRDTCRQVMRTLAEVRPISAGGIGTPRTAEVRDVSSEGLALVLSEPLDAGQRLSLEIQPPAGLPRFRFRRADEPVRLLAIVRYCRPDPAGFVAGCSIGVNWADTLADQMFPADLVARRRSA